MLKPMVVDDKREQEYQLLLEVAMAALELVDCHNDSEYSSKYLSLLTAVQDAVDAGLIGE